MFGTHLLSLGIRDVAVDVCSDFFNKSVVYIDILQRSEKTKKLIKTVNYDFVVKIASVDVHNLG